MSRSTRAAVVLAATACLSGFGAATASAETPAGVPEPTPAVSTGSANIGFCFNVPTPIPFLSFYACI